jgi:hypothetical protein
MDKMNVRTVVGNGQVYILAEDVIMFITKLSRECPDKKTKETLELLVDSYIEFSARVREN